MNKPTTTALLIFVSGLTLSTTAFAEQFTHGNGYVRAISNAYSNTSIPSVRSVQNTEYFYTMVASSGFNDRNLVENEEVTASPRIPVKTSTSGMLSTLVEGFNDRS